MLFNSVTFLAFLPLAFGGYWFLFGKSRSWQNLFVIIASYVFYGWWDWRFLLLIAFTSLWAYAFVLMDGSGKGRGRKSLLVLSCIVNLGILGVFKYYDFFVAQAVAALQALGFQAHHTSLQIILPIGISFYTFQALSYSIDVFRRTITPTKDVLAFFAYISFFPLLVAGPIERATNLLPQFLRPRTFSHAQAVEGCRQMLWGFFKKMVVADGCAGVANAILNGNIASPGWASYLVAFFCFSIQIYGDFSGYSDIAIGCSKLFGITAMRNFAFPYFSRDIAEFWRRWHISLTTWFRDYLYIPLGGSRSGKWKSIRNTFIVFLVSGLWHGANWTFVLWGFVHALFFLPLLLAGKNRKYLGAVAEGRVLPSAKEFFQMAATFTLAMAAWAIFRADSISQLGSWIQAIFSLKGGFGASGMSGAGDFLNVLPWIVVLFVVEWFNRGQAFGCAIYPKRRILRWICYCVLFETILLFQGRSESFIYFQF